MKAKSKVVFIDRDGVLNEMVYDPTHGLMDSPRRPEQVVLMPGVAAFFAAVRLEGYGIVVVTNQPGLAKGTLTDEELKAVNKRLADLLWAEGAAWDELRFCPHHPTGAGREGSSYVRECDCRKPKPGMLLQAAQEQAIDLGASWMVGDGIVDIQAGKAAGCRTILVSRIKIHDLERVMDLGCEPDFIVPDLAGAETVIRGNTL
jgi:D-glycero-D-manno-heptose 1,7-bisphosphate phosphatase